MQSSGRDLIVGLFVIAGLLAIVYLSLRVGGITVTGDTSIELSATFDDIGGLKVRAPVAVSGVKVGQVKSITLSDDLRALVTLAVESWVELSIDSEASIRTAGLLGDQFIAVEPGAEDELLEGGDEFAYTNSAISIDRLIGTLIHGNSLGGDE